MFHYHPGLRGCRDLWHHRWRPPCYYHTWAWRGWGGYRARLWGRHIHQLRAWLLLQLERRYLLRLSQVLLLQLLHLLLQLGSLVHHHLLHLCQLLVGLLRQRKLGLLRQLRLVRCQLRQNHRSWQP